MFSRRKPRAAFPDSSFCRKQTGVVVVALKIGGPTSRGGQNYLVTVGPDFDPYHLFSADTIVDAYRTFLLVVALIEANKLVEPRLSTNAADVLSSHLAFRNKPNALLSKHLGKTYDSIRNMRIGDMPDIIQQEHHFRTSGGGRRR